MFEIDILDVNSKVIAALKAAKIYDFKTVLSLSNRDLIHKTKLSSQDVLDLVKSVSQKVLKSNLVTSLQFHESGQHRVQRIAFGCGKLDDLLRGGIATGRVTEICGESASGKTQFCLQLSLLAQLSTAIGGLDCGVLYICTECAFPIKRLNQLVDEMMPLKTIGLSAPIPFMDNVTICQIGDIEELKKCINRYLPILAKARNVRLVIVDSVSAIFRASFSKNETRSRAENLQSLGYSLHCLSQRQNIAVVCVNQVTDTMSDSHHWCGPMESVAPALGLAWSNMVSTRLMLSRTGQRIGAFCENGKEIKLPAPAVVCKAQVIYAPDLPRSSAFYCVTASGLKSITFRTPHKRPNSSVQDNVLNAQ